MVLAMGVTGLLVGGCQHAFQVCAAESGVGQKGPPPGLPVLDAVRGMVSYVDK